MDKALTVALRAIGFPNAPNLTRRLPLSAKSLQRVTVLDQTDSTVSALPPVATITTSSVISIHDTFESLSLNNSNRRTLLLSAKNVGNSLQSPTTPPFDAVICDVTDIAAPTDLKLIYAYLHPVVSSISKGGRIVIVHGFPTGTVRECNGIGEDKQGETYGNRASAASAVSAAMRGFTKSLAKEVGLKGITVNSIELPLISSANISSSSALASSPVEKGRILSALHTAQFLLSPRAAFITGQTLSISQFLPSAMSHHEVNHASSATGGIFSFSGRVAVVTGAARGIGEYTARLFAAEGASKVILIDHPSMEDYLKKTCNDINSVYSFDSGASTLANIAAGPVRACYLTLDVTSAEAPALIAGFIRNTLPDAQVDAVVHNAGITRDRTFKRMKEADFAQVVEVNLAAITRIDAMLLSENLVANGGKLVYLSSIAGIGGGFGQTNYSASKAGLVGYVKALAEELAPCNISANAVAPGFIETDMTDAVPFWTRNIGRRINALYQGGHPVDVAESILFMASEASNGINGETLRVCGLHLVGK